MDNISSFSSRTFTLPDYTAPLNVYTFDYDNETSDYDVTDILTQISFTSFHHVITIQKWQAISPIVLAELRNDEKWERLATGNSYRNPQLKSSWKKHRQQVIQKLIQIQEENTQIIYLSTLNSAYRASEGDTSYLEYTISPSSLNWFFETLQSQVYAQIQRANREANESITKEDVISWFRVFTLINNNPTNEFKKQFNSLLEYEIPYGLSPATKSETLESLIKGAKSIALVPMLSGINSIGTALANGEWVMD